MPDEVRPPRWLKPANRMTIALQRLGLAIGTMPVSPLTVDGRRYIVGGFHQADWVKKARATGWGILACGRREERVTLAELPPEGGASILRDFPRKVPHGVQFFVRGGIVESADPEAIAAVAPRCPVFRVQRADEPA